MIACQAHNKWTVQMGDANASAAVFQDEMGVGKQVATNLFWG